jgi:ferredoxin
MPTVRFVNENREIEVAEGANLRQEAMKAGINLYPLLHKWTNCRGNGLCASCRVLIRKGTENVRPMGTFERVRLGLSMVFIGVEDKLRLACKTQVQGDIEVETKPPMNLFGEKFWG